MAAFQSSKQVWKRRHSALTRRTTAGAIIYFFGPFSRDLRRGTANATSAFLSCEEHSWFAHRAVTFLIGGVVSPTDSETRSESGRRCGAVFCERRLSQSYCQAPRRLRQRQILTGDTHSIKEVLWRGPPRCLPATSMAHAHTSARHQRLFLLSAPRRGTFRLQTRVMDIVIPHLEGS